MRVRSNGGDGVVVLEVAGLGAYTLLKQESGLHVLELPHEDDRSFDRVTVLVDVEPPPGTAGNPAGNRRIGESRRSCGGTGTNPHPSYATPPGLRTGRIDRVLAGDFDLLADAPPD